MSCRVSLLGALSVFRGRRLRRRGRRRPGPAAGKRSAIRYTGYYTARHGGFMEGRARGGTVVKK